MCEGIQKEGYTHKMCAHGMCLNHNPEWENVGSALLVPNPAQIRCGFLGLKRKTVDTWYEECCGKPMARYKKVQKTHCKKCGREGIALNIDKMLCLCCGYQCTYEHE